MVYPYEVYKADVGGKTLWVAISQTLPDCSGYGMTRREAERELEAAEQACLDIFSHPWEKTG